MALLPLLEEEILAAQREILKRWNNFVDMAKMLSQSKHNANSNPSTNSNSPKSHPSPSMATTNVIPIVKGVNGTRVHARLIHMPPHFTNCKPSLASLTSQDVGKILQLSGTVVRTSKVQTYESQRTFCCCEKKGCGTSFLVKADLHQ